MHQLVNVSLFHLYHHSSYSSHQPQVVMWIWWNLISLIWCILLQIVQNLKKPLSNVTCLYSVLPCWSSYHPFLSFPYQLQVFLPISRFSMFLSFTYLQLVMSAQSTCILLKSNVRSWRSPLGVSQYLSWSTLSIATWSVLASCFQAVILPDSLQ